MIVKSIIDTKGGDVVTMEPSASLDAAAKLLAERRIGAVVVLGADDRVVGILSERDIVRAIAERGAAAMQEQVSQVMTRKVVTCTLDETIHSIMERMTAGKFRHVPVIDQGKLAGIISIGDVVKHRIVGDGAGIRRAEELHPDSVTSKRGSVADKFAAPERALSQRGDRFVDRLARLVGGFLRRAGSLPRRDGNRTSRRSQPRIDRNVRRIAGQPRARDAVLHHVEGVHHHRREAGAAGIAEELPLERAFGAEEGADPVGRLRQFDRLHRRWRRSHG